MIIFCASYLYRFCVCSYLSEIWTYFFLSFLFLSLERNDDRCLKIVKVHYDTLYQASFLDTKIEIVQTLGSHKLLPCMLNWEQVQKPQASS